MSELTPRGETPAPLYVTKLQRFSTQDGPGVRTTVFLQGCPLRCAWCHNPETQSLRPLLVWTPRDCVGCGACAATCPTGARRVTPEGTLAYERELCTACGACARECPTGACALSAKAMTPEEIVRAVLRDAAFFGDEGGVTLSGGEPLLYPGVIPLMQACKAAGLSLAVETAGEVPATHMAAAAHLCDLFLFDIKDTDADRLHRMTGASLAQILQSLRLCDHETSGRIRLRCILVRGVNMDMTHYRGIAELYHSLTACEGVELIPYHAYAGGKAVQIGRPDNSQPAWIPSKDEIEQAKTVLTTCGVPVF